ncbi:hypothetical protein DXG01_000544 [Tephrocybe rancida]|nr:hypothetical protein DXG01_000544 [Tephrocybe rancida]
MRAIGSVKGFDDLYPKLLNLVAGEQLYDVTGLRDKSGIARVKQVLNNLHLEMVLGGFKEGHIHQENNYIVVHRVQPNTQKGYMLVAHIAISKGSKDCGYIDPIKLHQTRAKFIIGASINISSYEVSKNANSLQGMPNKLVEMAPVVIPQGLDYEGPYAEVIVPEYFPLGSIMIFETQMQNFNMLLDEFCSQGGQEAVSDLTLVDLNVILHHAEGEDVMLPGKVCQVEILPNLAKPTQWFKDQFDRVSSSVLNFMRPKYFALVISIAYKAARRAVIEQSSEFIASGHSFTQDLALCAVQMHGLVKSASLDPGAATPSLAAGLLHFTAGWARCWGRDVFISLRGLSLTTGNFEGAKKHILAFASTLKHGLIPNLLDSVWNPVNIQDYVLSTPDGTFLLSKPVKRCFPKDHTWVAWDDPWAYTYSSTVTTALLRSCGEAFPVPN